MLSKREPSTSHMPYTLHSIFSGNLFLLSKTCSVLSEMLCLAALWNWALVGLWLHIKFVAQLHIKLYFVVTDHAPSIHHIINKQYSSLLSVIFFLFKCMTSFIYHIEENKYPVWGANTGSWKRSTMMGGFLYSSAKSG